MSGYRKIIKFGSTAANSLPVYGADPLTYCIGNDLSQRFNHGSNADIYGQNSRPCQVYMAQRCATNWDDVCEYASSNATSDKTYAQNVASAGALSGYGVTGLSTGELLLLNTAREKYLLNSYNCELRTEPFNPLNPASPDISYYVGRNCVNEYVVNPMGIDGDVVMNKLLDNPRIAIDLLANIRSSMARRGTLPSLRGTRLGRFYGL